MFKERYEIVHSMYIYKKMSKERYEVMDFDVYEI